MLPSTGYFKGINCPFYDSGLCERPYCHFRHARKEQQSLANDGIENGAIFQHLVSEAVKKVLQHTDSSNNSQVVNSVDAEAKPGFESVTTKPTQKVTYNPTPISELQKNCTSSENDDSADQKRRHIPVPYTPRKPASLPRPVDTNGGESKPFIYIPPPAQYLPGTNAAALLDPYTPKGGTISVEQYIPGTEAEQQEYKPGESKSTSKVNYVPSDKSVTKKRILEYKPKPTKVSSKVDTPAVTYQPTPLSQVPCFSSDEDEPSSKKKRELSTDLNSLDELGAEFDIIDQILDEEKPKDEAKQHTGSSKENKDSKLSRQTHIKDKKHKSDKREKEKSDDKNKDKKERDKHNKSKNSDHKSSHKTSSRDRDKERDKKKDKDSYKNKNPSDSKSDNSSSKSSSKKKSMSSDSSIKSPDKSKHRSSSKSNSHDKKDKHKSSNKSSKDKNNSKDNKEKRKENPEKLLNTSDNDDFEYFSNFSEEIEEISDSDKEAIALECKKIFEEYVPTSKPRIEEELPKEETNSDEYIPTKKRISRTTERNIKIIPKEPIKPDFKKSAAEKMAERLTKIREFHAARNALSSDKAVASIQPPIVPSTIVTAPPTTGPAKIRIAHVPYASFMMNAKKTIPSRPHAPKSEPSTSTAIQTVKKGSQRVAHIPNEKFIDRPGVLEPLASKIPANIRSTYLNMMIDECIKIYLTATDAYARAQHEELATSKKCTAIQIYKNSAVLTVSRLRKEVQECNGIKKSASDCSTLQKIPTAISGTSNNANAGSWSIENKYKKNGPDINELKGAKFYKNISKWILSEDDLKNNGFPRPHPSGDKGKAIIHSENKKKPPKGIFRPCCRCGKEYTVDKKGFPIVKEECIYHPNRKYRYRGEVKYQCCSQDGMSDGCCVAPSHVYEYVDFENLKGYVRTMVPEKTMEDYGVYSLDCEMCYTTQGLDLTRITVIDSACKVVYETLIKPLHPIIDYNTRYSGITEEHMANVRTTLLEVQATLLSMFNSKTILIGHSLESDFKALKIIHDTVIDTSVLFPHKMGPPYKRALRNLSSEYLKKIIQNSVEGHDSAEDATVCMELLHYKLKEDLKTR